MSIRFGAILIFAAFLTSHVGYELSESSAAQVTRLHPSQVQEKPTLVSRTVVISKGQLLSGPKNVGLDPKVREYQAAGRIEFSYGVVLLTSSILLLSGLMLVWPSPRYEAV